MRTNRLWGAGQTAGVAKLKLQKEGKKIVNEHPHSFQGMDGAQVSIQILCLLSLFQTLRAYASCSTLPRKQASLLIVQSE